MSRALTRWLDQRTGYRSVVDDALYENVAGGARWRYVFGSMLVCAFVTQAITGIFLWMFYSPGSQNAWESVYYIQNEVAGGWLLRGVHHYMAQAMVVLLPLHLLQVVICRAYTAPREINYWLGLILMLLVLALGLTGYLLPWDQKGFWATKVATELITLVPGGGTMQKLVVGGDQYGHMTLTRFFALHAGVLPALLVGFLVLHVSMFRRHGVTPPRRTTRADQTFWPFQVWKDAVACLLLLGIVGVVTVVRGAELGPPAEPTESYGAARPEWYFLFLFQLLKKFQSAEWIGAIVVPAAVMGFLFLLPIIAKVRYGHVINVVVLLLLLTGAGYLTAEALYFDHYATLHPEAADGDEVERARYEESAKFLASREQAHREYERIRSLIEFNGIPRQGAAWLQSFDPETMGPRLFARKCASCHSYLDPEGEGIAASEVSAPNLYGVGTPLWYEQLFSPEQIAAAHMFGNTEHADGEMVAFVQEDLAELTDEQRQWLEEIEAALVLDANLPGGPDLDDAEAEAVFERGREALQQTFLNYACVDCHQWYDLGVELSGAPDLTGIYSYRWLSEFIADPTHPRFYGSRNDRMPSFAADPDPSRNLLTPRELDLIVRWLRGDNRELQDPVTAVVIPPSPPPALGGGVEPMPEEDPASDTVDEDTDAAAEVTEEMVEEPLGARVYRGYCARCHAYQDEQDRGIAGPTPRPGRARGAPNLYRFASREWLRGFLDPETILSDDYFGNTSFGQLEDGAPLSGGMVEYVHDTLVDLGPEERQQLEQIIAMLSAQAELEYQAQADAEAAADGTLEAGRELFLSDYYCIDCHKLGEDGDLGTAPDLTGYGSREWLEAIIRNPVHERFYPETNDRMPAFRDRLDDEEYQALIDWIRQDSLPDD